MTIQNKIRRLANNISRKTLISMFYYREFELDGSVNNRHAQQVTGDSNYMHDIKLDLPIAAIRIKSLFEQLVSKPINASYLITLVAGKFYTQKVTAQVIGLANIITELCPMYDWHAKLIITPFAPFNIINIFVTNNEIPQIVALNSTLLSKLSREQYNDDSMEYYHTSEYREAFINNWYKPLHESIYVYQPKKISQLYQDQIAIIEPSKQDQAVLNATLNNWEEQYIAQVKNNLSEHDADDIRRAIWPMTLGNLFANQHIDDAITSIEFNDCKTNPDINAVLEYLTQFLS